MLGIILGVATILLGAKAFTEKGIPLTNKKNLTGSTAKTIGVICIVLGVALVAWGALGVMGALASLGS